MVDAQLRYHNSASPLRSSGKPCKQLLISQLVRFLEFSYPFQELVNTSSIKMAVPLPHLVEDMCCQLPDLCLVYISLGYWMLSPAGTGWKKQTWILVCVTRFKSGACLMAEWLLFFSVLRHHLSSGRRGY